MSDSISFSIDFGPFKALLDAKEAEMLRACQQAVRNAARAGQHAAQKDAPIKTGRLRRSISPTPAGVRLTEGQMTIGVGPRTSPAWLYAGKEELRRPFMAAGRKAAEAALQAELEAAVNRVWRG